MNRHYRLRRSIDLQQVRCEGRRYAHPLLILIIRPNEVSRVRIAVAANKSVGGAFERNRSKRHIREAFRELLPILKQGFDILCMARKGVGNADYLEIKTALNELVQRAQMVKTDDDQRNPTRYY